MDKVNGLEALNSLLNGFVLEGGERYYKFNKELNELQYSDNKSNWQPSNISVNEILKWKNWDVIK